MTKKAKKLFIALSSVLAGLCNSLIGAGGGVILSLCLCGLAGKDFPDKRDVYVNSQASMIPGCALSCAIYCARGTLDPASFTPLALPAIAGGIIGSVMLPKIKLGWLKAGFALLVIWSGFRMMIS